MLKFERSFRLGIVSLFILIVVTTTTAMTMIEEMVPTSDSKIRHLLHQQEVIVELMLKEGAPRLKPSEFDEKLAGSNLALFDSRDWALEQEPHLALIRDYVSNPDNQLDPAIVQQSFQSLIDIQNQRINRELSDLRTMGLAGSWSVGILSFMTLAVLYVFQSRVRVSFLNPVTELVLGLRNWASGNRQRRLQSAEATPEIQESFSTINDLCDGEAHDRRNLGH